MIELTPCDTGVHLSVRAQGGARRNELRGEYDGALKVAVTQVPEHGKANKAIHAFLCKQLGLRRSQLTLLSGQTSPRKVFLVCEVPIQTLRQRIEESLGKT